MEGESYEDFIKRRREENREVMKHLGIYKLSQNSKAWGVSKTSTKTLKKTTVTPRKSKILSESLGPVRRSSRIQGKDVNYAENGNFNEELELVRVKPAKREPRENSFGEIPGVAIGTHFATRLDASHAGVHRPTVAGIHGNPSLGCYSIALSGGYEDDIDKGDEFVYTGEGGRDLKGTKANPKNLRTAPQSKDQVLERGNLALSKNVENKIPVRVLRGYKLNSDFAPEEGYRYDGLYMVTDYYLARGLSGYLVYKFRFERVKDQPPAPWNCMNNIQQSASDEENIPNQDEVDSKEILEESEASLVTF